MNKAHVQYLEARLIARAKEANRCELDNGNVPQLPTLCEADAADGEGFVVATGSRAVKEEVPSIHAYLSEMRRVLLEQEVLTEDGAVLRIAQDYTFNSPSTAAGVLLGRSANGRIEWKDAGGRSLREIQEAEESGS